MTPNIPREHPRILFRPGDFERLRSHLQQPPFQGLVESLRAEMEAAPIEPIPASADLRDFYQTFRAQNEAAMQQHYAFTRPISAAGTRASTGALLYRLTGERHYLDSARRALRELTALRFEDTTYALNHFFHSLIHALATGLDYLWDDLEPAEREATCTALRERASEFHPQSVQLAQRDPLNSHAICYGLPDMTQALLALYHHAPEAENWLSDVLAYMAEAFPGFGGDDGGWGQGVGYIHSQVYLIVAQMLYVGASINLFDIPWGRNNGKHLLYFQPPYGNCPNFGDAGYNRPKGLHKMIMLAYAGVYQDPYYHWYAQQIELPFYGSRAYLLSHFLTWPAPPAPQPPSDLPQAIHLRDIDWVAMHSDLADKERNVMLQFKSSRFGSFNHSHADQNSFLLEAFGQPLLIDSGYYPWYGSPHDTKWTRQTRAHNALLINGKGQGVWNQAASGQITAFATSPDFDYCAGDATEAYRQPSLNRAPRDLCATAEGVVRMVRHIVFARPNVFVLLDEVETEQPAAIQFLLHGLHAFQLDEAQRVAAIANGPARARIYLLEPGPVTFTQTDQFSDAPEHPGNVDASAFANQWHFTGAFAPTAAYRRLLTVIVVDRTDQETVAPEVERWEGKKMIGARIGDTSVEFRFDSGFARVTCRGIRADGAATWFEYSGTPGK